MQDESLLIRNAASADEFLQLNHSSLFSPGRFVLFPRIGKTIRHP
jgi:hypothetical protein